MENENEYENVDVTTQEEQTSEEVVEIQEETQEEDALTLSGEDKAEFEKWKAKKEERQRFAEKAKSQPQKPAYNVTADKLERMELKLDGYSSDEVEAIMDLGGSKALSNPLVKGAIEQMRAKAKSQDASQSLNSKSPVYKKFTQEDLSKMSSAELEKILPRG